MGLKEDERGEGGKNSYCHLPSVTRGDYKHVTELFISKYTSVPVNLKLWAVYYKIWSCLAIFPTDSIQGQAESK